MNDDTQPADASDMPDEAHVNRPWLIAAWPGMGHVASGAAYYLLTKLGMHLLNEFTPHELFEVEHVEVRHGLVRTGRLPRSRLFVWKDPRQRNDLILFIAEAQPPAGKYAFCHRLIDQALNMNVERVFTFAAMATQMKPTDPARVFGAATDIDGVMELRQLGLEVLEDGHIGGLNGVLLGVAAERGLRGTCLLGEMPHLFPQLPFPRASLSVLEVFAGLAGVDIDFDELRGQADVVEGRLTELIEKIQRATDAEAGEGEGESESGEAWKLGPEPEDEALSAEDEQRIERLFDEVAGDRSKAYELKAELDRLGVFTEYEDRFLDLFKAP